MRDPAPSRRAARGFTLVELLATIAVLALVISLGVPALDRLVSSSRVAAWSALYVQSLHTMRQVAIERGRHVTLCELEANRCTGRWGPRLALFFDDDRDGRLARDLDLIMEVRMPGEDDALGVRWRGFGQQRFLNVRSSGAYRQNGRFVLCPGPRVRDREGREIILNVTGRLRVGRLRCA